MSNDLKPLSEADYDAIEEAVLETSRGRWFLTEYARRNRNADTTLLLDAIGKLERSIDTQTSSAAAGSFDQIRFDIVEMAAAIAQTKREIASIKPEGEDQGHVSVATEELDAIVGSTETATQEILGAAERIQELAWGMREDGVRDDLCEQLDKLVTGIYTSCSFQDLTGQRISKVVSVLLYLEERLETMRQIWGDEDTAALDPPASEGAHPETRLLNGPQSAGNGLDQDGIDLMIDDEEQGTEAAHETEPQFGDDRASAKGTGLEINADLDDGEEIVFAEEDADDDGALALEAAEEVVTLTIDDDDFAMPSQQAGDPGYEMEFDASAEAAQPSDMDDDFLPESFDGDEDEAEGDGHIIMVRKSLEGERAGQSDWREADNPPDATDADADAADTGPLSAEELSDKDKAALFS
ncbi:MAG: hypothetical protein ACR2PM_11550 [Hyphomicrobiales bacterium]